MAGLPAGFMMGFSRQPPPKGNPMKESLDLQGIGIPFFTPEEWAAAKTVMQDAHTFDRPYSSYLQQIESSERQLRARGVATIRVDIRLGELVAWCKTSGHQVNSKGCAAYAAYRAMQIDGS